jgi:hypothetical protein
MTGGLPTTDNWPNQREIVLPASAYTPVHETLHGTVGKGWLTAEVHRLAKIDDSDMDNRLEGEGELPGCHTPFQERGNEASIRVPRIFKSHV